MRGLKKLIFVLSTGYILMFYSELLFWSRYKPEADSVGGYLMTWALYSVTSFAFITAVNLFKARSIWALFLCGALYGWLTEGVIVQTMYNYEAFPFYISWTGLAWHALISVLVGFYCVRKVLLERRPFKIVCLAGAIGLFWGFWAVCWWVEEPGTSPGLLGFAVFAFSSSLPLIACYWICERLSDNSFSYRKWELYAVILLFVSYFLFLTLPAAPVAALVLPPLLLLLYLSLRKNRRVETRTNILESLVGSVRLRNYLYLWFAPLIAVLVYGILEVLGVKARTNIFVAIITTPTGAILFVLSMVMIFKTKPQNNYSLDPQSSTS
jgi:hypothetical protein